MSAWKLGALVWCGLTLSFTLIFLSMGAGSFGAASDVSGNTVVKHLVLSGVITAPVGVIVLLLRLRRLQKNAAEKAHQQALRLPLPEGVVRFRFGTRRRLPVAVLCLLVVSLLQLGNYLHDVWQLGPVGGFWLTLLLLELVVAGLIWLFLGYLRVAVDGGQVVTVTNEYIELPRRAWRADMVRMKWANIKSAGLIAKGGSRRLELSDGETVIVIPGMLMSRLELERMGQLIRARAIQAVSYQAPAG